MTAACVESGGQLAGDPREHPSGSSACILSAPARSCTPPHLQQMLQGSPAPRAAGRQPGQPLPAPGYTPAHPTVSVRQHTSGLHVNYGHLLTFQCLLTALGSCIRRDPVGCLLQAVQCWSDHQAVGHRLGSSAWAEVQPCTHPPFVHAQGAAPGAALQGHTAPGGRQPAKRQQKRTSAWTAQISKLGLAHQCQQDVAQALYTCACGCMHVAPHSQGKAMQGSDPNFRSCSSAIEIQQKASRPRSHLAL